MQFVGTGYRHGVHRTSTDRNSGFRGHLHCVRDDVGDGDGSSRRSVQHLLRTVRAPGRRIDLVAKDTAGGGRQRGAGGGGVGFGHARRRVPAIGRSDVFRTGQVGDGGITWSPGNVPDALAPEPDALATDGTDGAVAVLAGADGRVVTSDADLTTWHTLSSVATLARSSAHCTVAAVSAVAISASGSPVIGARCKNSSVVGVFVPSATPGSWTPVGPTFVGRGSSTTTVLRLHAWSQGTSALVEGGTTGATKVLGAWFGANGPSAADVRESPPLAVPTGWSIRATAVGGGTGAGLVVLLGSASGTELKIDSVAGPGQAWVETPAPPTGTTAIAAVGTETDAFVPSGSHLVIWATTTGSSTWTRVAHKTVPIQYGSSS